MNAKRIASVLIIVLAVLALSSWGAAAQEEPIPTSPQLTAPVSPAWWNMLQNSSFETGTTNPANWNKQSFQPGAIFEWVTNQSVDGGKSVKITLNAANDARWIQSVPVQPNTDYVLSGWIKTLNVAHTGQSYDAGANLSVLEVHAPTPALFGTNDWTYVKVVFNSGSNNSLFIYARLGYFSGTTTGTAWFDNIQLAPVKKLYVSSNKGGSVSGVKFAPADVLVHNPVLNTWAMYFDGSDVGITKNVDCIEVLWTGSIIMSLQYAQNVPGLGMVQPQDLIVFQPTSTGANTSGIFYWQMDGSSVGLNAASENIDACSYGGSNVISTTGATDIVVPGGKDEDLFRYGMSGLYWEYFLHGNTVPNLGPEDVWGHSWGLQNTSDKYLSTQNTYYPGNGAQFTNKQIFVVHTPWPELFWDGPSHGFNYVIDSFSIER